MTDMRTRVTPRRLHCALVRGAWTDKGETCDAGIDFCHAVVDVTHRTIHTVGRADTTTTGGSADLRKNPPYEATGTAGTGAAAMSGVAASPMGIAMTTTGVAATTGGMT